MPQDSWPLHQLESDLTPPLVRQLEGLTSLDWSRPVRRMSEIVVEREGRVVGWISWGVRLSPSYRRMAMLLVRSMFASEQTRALVTNVLGRQPGVTQPVLEHILDGSSNAAKRNITRVTPQLAALIREIERWLTQTAEATHD